MIETAPATARDSRSLLRRYARRRDPRDLERLVVRFRPLARALAHRYARGGEPLDDLEQTACMGLVKALQRFDPDRGYAFASYAVPTILGELRRSFRDTAWSAHVPRGVQERAVAVHAASERHAAERGRGATVRELTEALGCDEERVVEALVASAAMSPLSLQAADALEDDDAPALSERLGAEDDGYRRVEDRSAVTTALACVTDAQRDALRLRFGGDLKQSEIARAMGVSQMQVSRLLRSGVERLAAVARSQSQPPGRGAGEG
jgi:RNA polymerase sigma-B factor